MTYSREMVERLVPAIWDSTAAWGMANPYEPDVEMRGFKSASNPKESGTLWAHLADIRRAWERAPLTMPERRAVISVYGLDMTQTEAAVVLKLPRTTVQHHAETGVGRLTAWLNGDTYFNGYGLDENETRQEVQV